MSVKRLLSALLFLACCCCAFGQITPPPSGGGGGGTPASPSGSVQFNNSGAFGGSANLLWDNANGAFNILSSGITNIVAIGTDPILGDPDCGALFIINCDSLVTPTNAAGTGQTSPAIELFTATGGSTSIATNGIGGSGGQIRLQSAPGGKADSANTSSTGGVGGLMYIASGVGADSILATGNNLGGHGGKLQLQTGKGGNAASGATNNGGNGGDLEIDLGAGGTGSTMNGTAGQFLIVGASTVFSVTSTGNTSIAGSFAVSTTSPIGSANAAVCWKTVTTLGFCSTVVGAGGTCTCN